MAWSTSEFRSRLGSRRVVRLAQAGLLAALSTSGNVAVAGGGDPTTLKTSGFSAALRAGYAAPFGEASAGRALGEVFVGVVPIWLDAMYRFTEQVSAGVYAQYGVALLTSTVCVAGASCSGTQARVGFQVQHRFAPGAQLDPWMGIGFGYELASYRTAVGQVNASYDTTGFEYLNAQLGLSFRAERRFGLGPFVSLSLSQYWWEGITPSPALTPTADPAGGSLSRDIPAKGLHQWLTVGLRGVFDF